MLKLKSIHIEGFKDPKRTIDLTFAEGNVSVIYGQNGSGKTTFLNLLAAIFEIDGNFFKNENIEKIILNYTKKEQIFVLTIEKDKEDFIFTGNVEDFWATSSILCGTNRSIVGLEKIKMEPTNMLTLSGISGMLQPHMPLFDSKNLDKKRHINTNFIAINDIETLIINQYKKGQDAISQKVKNAFFNTISDMSENENAIYEFPDDFNSRIDNKKNILIPSIKLLEEPNLRNKILSFLSSGDATVINGNKTIRALLLNMLEKVEEENIEFESINALIDGFNSHLYRNKKLIVTEKDAYIEYREGEAHDLNQLSSGEQHLLTFLTLFLITGRDRDFFLMDEPEISLNMAWQRELLPLLSRINPNTQIIVATHSPAIAHKHTEYLVELV